MSLGCCGKRVISGWGARRCALWFLLGGGQSRAPRRTALSIRAQPARCATRRLGAGEVVVSDAARRGEIEAMMRTDGGKAYWGDPGVQREYSELLARLAGEAPPLSPQAPVAPAPAAGAAEPPPAPAEP